MDVQVKVEGLDDIVRKLGLLPDRVGNRALRRALRKGANVIRDNARVNARALDDNLSREAIYKNIVTQGMGRRREKATGGVGMRVGVLGGAKKGGGGAGNPGGDTFYWRFLEFGTSNMKARPFMRQAIAQGADKAFAVTVADMEVQLDKELAKLGP